MSDLIPFESSQALQVTEHTRKNQNTANPDFPTLCIKCLGNSSFVKFKKDSNGAECRMCGRVFIPFTWFRGEESQNQTPDGASEKAQKKLQFSQKRMKTLICPVCAALKNVCQCCLLDFTLNIPSYIRDNVVAQLDPGAANAQKFADKSYVSRLYESELAASLMGDETKAENAAAHPMIMHRAATSVDKLKEKVKDPLYFASQLKRNLSLLNPQKFSALSKSKMTPTAPQDLTIKTLYVGNVNSIDISADDVRSLFSAYGQIIRLKINESQRCAFVTFFSRESAELAMESLFQNCVIKGHRLSLMWAKLRESRPEFRRSGKYSSREQAAENMILSNFDKKVRQMKADALQKEVASFGSSSEALLQQLQSSASSDQIKAPEFFIPPEGLSFSVCGDEEEEPQQPEKMETEQKENGKEEEEEFELPTKEEIEQATAMEEEKEEKPEQTTTTTTTTTQKEKEKEKPKPKEKAKEETEKKVEKEEKKPKPAPKKKSSKK